MFKPSTCGRQIAAIETRLFGKDFRDSIKECAWETVGKGQDAQAFKDSLLSEVQKTISDETRANKFVDDIWSQIEDK